MIKKILIISLLLLSVIPVFAQEEDAESEQVSGLVRVVRSSPETEIFFIDRKESVIVPSFHPEHNKVVKMSLESIKNKKPISLSAHPVSRRMISAGTKKTIAPVAVDLTEIESAQPVSSKPSTKSFKEIPSDNAQ